MAYDFSSYRAFALEQFTTFVKMDTQSDPTTGTYPSTEKQIVLLDHMRDYCQAEGLENIVYDGRGVVMATLPGESDCVTVGFIAHVDTSPEMSGKDVKPIVHEKYEGGDLVLPLENVRITPEMSPQLALYHGDDLITSSGDTLLGADDKAGMAAIVVALKYLKDHPEIKHAPIRVAFTPDEEIGEGTDHFDVEAFAADCAYTIDGSTKGELESENFCADGVVVTFTGTNTHPGYAKDKLKNSIKALASFIESLPDDLSPEETELREGFVHPYDMKGTVELSTVTFILRDFEEDQLDEYASLIEALAVEASDKYECPVKVERKQQYRNMKSIIDAVPRVLAIPRRAIVETGIEVLEPAVRGGTDGAQLSFRGLPTPNIFNGAHLYHSRYEWASLQDILRAAEVIVRTAVAWADYDSIR